MAEFKCPVPGCTWEGKTENGLRGHISKSHRGWSYRGGAAIPPGEDVEDYLNKEGEWITTENKEPVNEMNNLRRILEINGIINQRESIIELFQYGNTRDLSRLKSILKKAGVTPGRADMVVEAWKNYLGDEIMDEDSENGEEKKSKAKGKNPLQLDPDEMMDMGLGDIMSWAMKLKHFAQQQEIMMRVINTVFGPSGGPFGTGQTQNAQIPKELEDRLKKLDMYEEQERWRRYISPVMEELKELKGSGGGKKDGGTFDEILDRITLMKAIESLGSDEKALRFRAEMDERMEKMRIDRDKDMEKMRVEQQGLQAKNYETQMSALQKQFDLQMQHMGQLMQMSGKHDDLRSILAEAKDTAEMLEELRGGEGPEDRKNKAMLEMVETVTKTLQPVAMKIAENFGKRGSPNSQGGSPRARPGKTVEAEIKDDMTTIHCVNCDSDFSVKGRPPSVVCPNCSTEYTSQEEVKEPAQPMNEEELWAQRREDLLMQERQKLDEAARMFGIEPEQYPNKAILVDELIRLARQQQEQG